MIFNTVPTIKTIIVYMNIRIHTYTILIVMGCHLCKVM